MLIDTLFLGGTSIDLIQDRVGSRHACSLHSFTSHVGGSVTNTAIISAKLGLKAALLSRISKDPLGNFAREFLDSLKIDTKGIIQDSDIRTPLAIAKIDKSGIAKYTFYKNSPRDSVVTIKSVPKYLLNSCKVFHTGSSYSYQKETFEETLKFIKYLKKRNVFISYDPNIRPNSIKIKDHLAVKNRVLTLLNLADLAKLSETDLEYLTDRKNPLRGLRMLKKQVKSEIILTLGSKGCAYLPSLNMSLRGAKRRSNLIKIPAFKVKIADTIGAGDAFTAGLIYKLIEQGRAKFFLNIKPNMIFASAVSAIICTQNGANQALKDIKQVNSFLKLHTPPR
ncbi:MAG: carbohydrate kinase [Candidatus Omnitrophota bacterium]|nr:carbohydrate kinase [Candidatus Omnitrophota bacterium]